jgi:hypothetical protein
VFSVYSVRNLKNHPARRADIFFGGGGFLHEDHAQAPKTSLERATAYYKVVLK